MPIYEYECPKCGQFEVVQKASDKPLKAKPDCSDKKCPKKATRLISASAFHLKGGGWYKTDYAGSSSNGGKPKSSTKSEANAESKVTTSSESSSKSSSPEAKKAKKSSDE